MNGPGPAEPGQREGAGTHPLALHAGASQSSGLIQALLRAAKTPIASQQLRYYPTVTRQSYRNMGRVTTLIESGKLFTDLGLPPLSPAHDRAMICGSPAMLRDLKHLLEQRGFKEGNTSTPGDFVIERAFADQ